MDHLERMKIQAGKRLPKGESIIHCVPGDYRQSDAGGQMIPMGIIAATERCIFYLSTALHGFTMEEFPYEDISHIEYAENTDGFTFSLVTIHHQSVLKWTSMGDLKDLAAYARKFISSQVEMVQENKITRWQSNNITLVESSEYDSDTEYYLYSRKRKRKF